MNTPDFLVIGPSKTGTTALHSILELHPNLNGSEYKELHYFDNNFDNTFEWYKKQFKDGTPDQLTFESTPNYFENDAAMVRIHDTLPDVKVICILRNPVDRIISRYTHFRSVNRFKNDDKVRMACVRPVGFGLSRWNGEEQIFDDIIKNHINSPDSFSGYFTPSKYIDCLTFMNEIFGRENIYIGIYDDFKSDPQSVVDDMCKFLGVPIMETGEIIQRNTSKMWLEIYDSTADIKPEHIEYMRTYFKPYNEKLEKYINRELDWNV